jgi:hypothetical protein
MFPYHHKDVINRIKPIDVSVSGFGNSKIAIEGSLNLPLQFHNSDTIQTHSFLVLADSVKTSISCLLGVKILAQFNLSVNIKRNEGKNIPYVTKRSGNRFLYIKSAYISDHEMSKCISNKISLTSGEVQFVKVFFNPFTTFTSNSEVITSAPLDNDHMDKLKIQTIKSSVYEDTYGNKYAFCSVINDSNHVFQGKIHCLVENFNDFDLKPITKESVEEMKQRKLNILCEVDLGGDIIDYEYEVTAKKVAHINFIQKPLFGQHIGCDPSSQNNNTPHKDISLSDSRCPIPVSTKLTPEIEKILKEKPQVNLGMQELDDQDIESTLEKQRGYALPKHIDAKPEDSVDMSRYEDEVKPYIRKIFINKYSNTIPLFSMDVGNISKFLGKYRLKLQDGAQLPKQRKIFFQSPIESSHMKSILDFMVKLNIIAQASTTGEGERHQYSSPAFLVAKKDPEASGRLIVDYSGLNSQLLTQPCALPNIQSIISQLKGKCFYSNIDISNAFNSIDLTDESQKLTLFSCAAGNYVFKKLPTGVCSSPEILNRFMDRMIHYVVARDKNGKVILLEDGTAKLNYEPLADVFLYYDDVLIATKWIKDYETSKLEHFKVVEEVVKRLSEHQSKISINKCSFFSSSIKFLGWEITRDFIRVDPDRVKKILSFKLPKGTKNWRQFLGTVNSIRTVLGHSILDHVNKLTMLTSDKHNLPPTKEQEKAFYDILKALTSAPLFANLIDPSSPKIVFSDASSASTGCFSGLLCQIVEPTNKKTMIAPYLVPEDKCHRIIHEKQYSCIPIPYMYENEEHKDFMLRIHVSNPPELSHLKDVNMGLSPNELEFSLSKTLNALFHANNMKTTLVELGAKCIEELKKGILKAQIRDFILQCDKSKLIKFTIQLEKGLFICDPDLYIISLVAKALQRPITVISNFPLGNGEHIKQLNHDKTKTPFFILLYKQRDSKIIITRPAYISRTHEYDLKNHRGSLEFLAWFSKPIPKTLSTRHILDLENFGILLALHTFRKFISRANDLLMVTDSRPLYFLFSPTVQESSVKIDRWAAKLLDSYPQMRLAFVTSKLNFSDIISRDLHVSKPNPSLFQTPRCVSNKIEELLPNKPMTLNEFREFVSGHPELLTYDMKKEIKQLTSEKNVEINMINNLGDLNALTSDKIAKIQIEQSIQNLKLYLSEPLSVLETYLTTEQIIEKQRDEYKTLHDKLIIAVDFKLKLNNIEYKLANRVIFIKVKENWKIYLPESLIKYLVAFVHLRCGHGSYKIMRANVDNYYCKNLYKYIESFTKSCLPCFYNNKTTHHLQLGLTPSPNTPYEGVYIDYSENLTPTGEIKGNTKLFKHVLIIADMHSGAVQLFPTRTKTMGEFIHIFRHSVWAIFRPSYIIADNALSWANESIIEDLAVNCKVSLIKTSSLHPQTRGFIEAKSKILKTTLKKTLALAPNYSWVEILPTISQLLNTSKQLRTNKAPFDIIFGSTSRISQGLWDTLKSKPKLHPLAHELEAVIDKKNEEKNKIDIAVQKEINAGKINRNEGINKNRKKGDLKKGDIVFVLDKNLTKFKLDTTYLQSPYIVVEARPPTATVFRIADGSVFTLDQESMKKFTIRAPLFDDMPQNIKNILVKDIKTYDNADLIDIINFDTFELPKSAYKRGVYFDPEELDTDSSSESESEFESESESDD